MGRRRNGHRRCCSTGKCAKWVAQLCCSRTKKARRTSERSQPCRPWRRWRLWPASSRWLLGRRRNRAEDVAVGPQPDLGSTGDENDRRASIRTLIWFYFLAIVPLLVLAANAPPAGAPVRLELTGLPWAAMDYFKELQGFADRIRSIEPGTYFSRLYEVCVYRTANAAVQCGAIARRRVTYDLRGYHAGVLATHTTHSTFFTSELLYAILSRSQQRAG